ncbi:hypothetical protein FAIPA1_240053 [Frankia sp. AiPs1]
MEAGVAYWLALFVVVYLFARPGWNDRPVLLALAAGPILVGGVLSMSKIFLLCGVPISIPSARPYRHGNMS